MVEKISEGAEAIIYDVEVAGFDAVLKDRIAKEYREPELDNKIRGERTRLEAKILARASSSGINVPKVLMIGKNKIFIEKLSGNTLNHMLDSEKPKSIIQNAAKQLALLHKADIIHGDFTPANVFVTKDDVYVIDFGLGEISNSQEEKALDVLLMKRSISKELYKIFEQAYLRNYKNAKPVLNRLAEIEKRGRYQTRTLLEAR